MSRDNLNPTSCRAALVKLDRRIPSNWTTACDLNTMIVLIDLSDKMLDIKSKEYKAYLYRELANSLVNIALKSPEDNLERVDWIKVSIKHKDNQIDALTSGKDLYKLATITDSNLIAQHIHNTVKVKELIK